MVFNKLIKTILLLVPFAAIPLAEPVQEKGLDVWGVLQNDLIVMEDYHKAFKDQFEFTGSNMLTLNAKNRQNKYGKIEASADLILLYGAYADLYGAYPGQPVITALGATTPFLLDVRKLYGELYLPFADVSVGRQIINFGQGMVFSPIDVFTSVNLFELTFRRRGSDVARVKVPLGDVSGIDIVGKLNSRKQGATAALKAFTNIKGFDLSATGIYRGDLREGITGICFKGDAFIGVYGELVEHWREAGSRNFCMMLGADYSVSNTWYFMAEYLYNEMPLAPDSASLALFSKTGQLNFSRHYGFAMARYTINEIMNVSANVISDIPHKSAIFTGQYFYNVFQNTNLTFYGRYYYGSFDNFLPKNSPELQYGLRVEIKF
jgi:hypothetical protein